MKQSSNQLPKMTEKCNELISAIKHNTLIDFKTVSAEDFTPAINYFLKKAQDEVQKVCAENNINWENIITRLNLSIDPLERVWSLLNHLNAVVDNPDLRKAHQDNLTRVTNFFTNFAQNPILYLHYQKLDLQLETTLNQNSKQTEEYRIQKKIIQDALRNFRLGGANLSPDSKAIFASIQEEQARLSKAFSERVLDATNGFSYIVQDPVELEGLPEDTITAARMAAIKSEKTGWKFTLHRQSYVPVMQYAKSRKIRKNLYAAYITRASSDGTNYAQGKKEWDTTDIIKQLLKLRHEEAQLLGFQNFAELSLESKMAASPKQVDDFLNNLSQRARPFAEKDYQTLQNFSKEHLAINNLEPFDIAYASEKLREKKYQFSEETLRQYFPQPSVLNGLFKLANELFDISIQSRKVPVWHKDVHFYDVFRNNECIAHFYLDLFARKGKRSGAWMDSACTRYKKKDGTIQRPVAYLITNFPPPLEKKPSLLSHDDVITLFHEFGHGLHHMLSQIDEREVSGINGIEWDAVELPSQFMENFCWNKQIIASFAKHWQTQEPLPEPLFEKMLAAKNFHSSLGMLRQVVLSIFDMDIHSKFSLEENLIELSQAIHKKHHVYSEMKINNWPNSFEHIFSGGYAAGYYSYKWAEVLSADAFDLFESQTSSGTQKIVNKSLGKKFEDEILSVGGSRKAIESFQAFRGRPPKIDALLRHNGMDDPITN